MIAALQCHLAGVFVDSAHTQLRMVQLLVAPQGVQCGAGVIRDHCAAHGGRGNIEQCAVGIEDTGADALQRTHATVTRLG